MKWVSFRVFGQHKVLTVHLGPSLHKRGRKAVAGFVRFDRLFQHFIMDLHPSHVEEWTAQVLAYEADNTLPDPYHWKQTGKFAVFISWLMHP